MNNSGKTLFKVLSALKIDISQALLVYDELDVVLGKVSLSKKEEKKVSHRGVQDVIVNFPRRKILKLKVGIRPFSAKKIEIRSFVMEDFSSEELEKVLEIKSTIFRIFQGFIDLSEKHMQNPLNYLKKI
ncbi:hypothetical protein PVNG_02475 [Plasmodium vivax North Korean]|uniref:Uncharacterized protein n=1 Tax=Plasmodium vivax North Korean TaxID=1035514 RepID=A0A0J9TNN8_PLAVI|nr:hypothetical protein PVNG_02475 [Plasmodium vivax North Korean]